MPRLDGNGPLGQGPMTGKGCGYCVLRSSKENPDQMDGFAGIGGKPVVKGDFAIVELPASPSESDIKPEQAKALLQEQLQILERQKHQIGERLDRLEAGHRLIAVVLYEKCGGCGICKDVCLEHAIEINKQASVNEDVCIAINKCDLNPDVAQQIETDARKRNMKVVGKIRYDDAFTKAQIMKCSVVEYTGGAVSEDIKALWRNVTYAY